MQTFEDAAVAVETSGPCLFVLDGTGDSRMQWDRNDPAQVAAAEARFDEMRGKGYSAYKVDASGRRGEVINKFDPDAERIIMHRQLVGG